MMKIDMERKLIYNCDPATPQNIDFSWLQEHPGQLFNTPLVVQERQQMLVNQRNTSCENCCWRAEDIGSISPRLLRHGDKQTHKDVVTTPTIIDLTISSDCNLTCSYCVKEYSSAWRRDIINNGDYSTVKIEDDRYTLNLKDRVIDQNSQPNRLSTTQYQQLLNEVTLMAGSLETLIITGGEPLLNNSLLEILENVRSVPDIKIFTGLGVDLGRFTKLVTVLREYPNIRFAVSAEATEGIYEFNRYGVTWSDFSKKIDLLEKNNIRYNFHSTLSNLTVMGFVKFNQQFSHRIEAFDLVYKPDFMAVHVLDDNTKHNVVDELANSNISNKDQIIQSMQATPTDQQRNNIKEFLKEFTRRRPTLDVTIYPKEFLDWMNYVV